MPSGVELSVLRTMLAAHCGNEPSVSVAPGAVALDNQLLNDYQRILVSKNAFLQAHARAEIPLTVGTQYYAFPSTLLDQARVKKPAFVKQINLFSYDVWFGIGQREYNAFNSAAGITGSPVRRWDMVMVNGAMMVEVWPVPNVAQTLMLDGTIPVTPMVADTDVCMLDDLLIVLWAAAARLRRIQPDEAAAKRQEAMEYLQELKASSLSRHDTFNISGAGRFFEEENKRPVVGVTQSNP